MAGKTRYLEHATLNQFLRGITGPTPAAVYVGLFTSPPSDTGSGTEVSATGYARVAVTFIAPTNGVCSNMNMGPDAFKIHRLKPVQPLRVRV